MVFNAFLKVIQCGATASLLRTSVASGCGSQVCVQGQSCAVQLHKHCPGHWQYCTFMMVIIIILIITEKLFFPTHKNAFLHISLVSKWDFQGQSNQALPGRSPWQGSFTQAFNYTSINSPAISLVSFVSVPQTSSATESCAAAAAEPLLTCQQFCQHHSRAAVVALSTLFHIQTNPSGRALASNAQWSSWILTSPLWDQDEPPQHNFPIKWVTFLPSLLFWIEILAEC